MTKKEERQTARMATIIKEGNERAIAERAIRNTAERIIERYLSYREQMEDNGVPIPPRMTTDYCNAVRTIARQRVGGMYSGKLVITGEWLQDPEVAKPIFETAIDQGYIIVAR